MKEIILAVAVAATAAMAVASSASADVSRCEATTGTTTATFTVIQPAQEYEQWGRLWTHNYTVIVNADGSFSGTGEILGDDQNGPFDVQVPHVGDDETVTGRFDNGTVTLHSIRVDGLVTDLVNAQTGDLSLTAPITVATLRRVHAAAHRKQGVGSGARHRHDAGEEPRPVRQGAGRRQDRSAGVRWDAAQLHAGRVTLTTRTGWLRLASPPPQRPPAYTAGGASRFLNPRVRLRDAANRRPESLGGCASALCLGARISLPAARRSLRRTRCSPTSVRNRRKKG